jgi:hypothetical protein
MYFRVDGDPCNRSYSILEFKPKFRSEGGQVARESLNGGSYIFPLSKDWKARYMLSRSFYSVGKKHNDVLCFVGTRLQGMRLELQTIFEHVRAAVLERCPHEFWCDPAGRPELQDIKFERSKNSRILLSLRSNGVRQ